MKSSAHPADSRASRTRGTVKKRTMTWGSPAVPIIKASAMKKTSMRLLLPVVYAAKPSSVTIRSSFSSRKPPPSTTLLPNASCGIGVPVTCSEMNTAGTV